MDPEGVLGTEASLEVLQTESLVKLRAALGSKFKIEAAFNKMQGYKEAIFQIIIRR